MFMLTGLPSSNGSKQGSLLMRAATNSSNSSIDIYSTSSNKGDESMRGSNIRYSSLYRYVQCLLYCKYTITTV